MFLTLDLMPAFVRCHYKAHLKCTGEVGASTEFELLERALSIEYQEMAIAWLKARYAPNDILSSPPCLEDVLQSDCLLILDIQCQTDRGSITIPAMASTVSRTSTTKHEYALIATSPNKRLSRNEKLTAAMLGSALSTWHGLKVPCVNVIHGPQFSTTKHLLLGTNGPTVLGNEAAAMLHDLEVLAVSTARPPMYLNDHCGICEFRDRCRTDAIGRDDLSLLRGLSQKEIDAWKKRGIFTVTQLAHTFRMKSIMGRSSHASQRHSQPLQAMAIRDKKTYVRKCPEMPDASTHIHFDVEGIPEQDFFYLIGAVVVRGGTLIPHQFWADAETDQQDMWRKFLSLLEGFGDYKLVHYGRYDKDFIREMQRRYGDGDQDGNQLLPRLFDVHAAIRTNVYFPVYSNTLKEIATILGFQWTGPVRSGLQSIVWRKKWEKTRDESVKSDLLRYNEEDCLAVMSVFSHLATLSQGGKGYASGIEATDKLTDFKGGNFSSKEFATPALRTITKCAYFNYQQDKVFFRTDRNVRRSTLRKRRATKAHIKVNTVLHCNPPDKCPTCGGSALTRHGGPLTTKIIKDLKFFSGGVKRWVVQYTTERFVCRSCRRSCLSPEYPTEQRVVGPSIGSWTIYQHVALSQSYDAIVRNMFDLFGYYFGDGMPQTAFRHRARLYKATEDLLLSKLRCGNVICGDETKIALKGKQGYIWVFSGPEVVIYRFNEARDGTVLNEVVKDFKGVLVSDFYGVYDSVLCQQQKCLVHLTRDINDDLLKSPFDDDLKEVANRFTAVMTPIIEAIDRYGLVKRHLGKFVKDAERFCKWVADQSFTSKTAQHYQKRVGKYGNRLFTFLSWDGVPWNNNLAENAVKLIASRRRFIGGVMSEDGIRKYLILLSIYQTLRRKGGSFLEFLQSGKTDVFEFVGE